MIFGVSNMEVISNLDRAISVEWWRQKSVWNVSGENENSEIQQSEDRQFLEQFCYKEKERNVVIVGEEVE